MNKLDEISVKKKALGINLSDSIYGSFAEIGAGQEVVRHFFRVGGASGTIANAMSAYDKEFSDAKYGKEESGRYVCKSRLKKMLDFEYNLLEDRLTTDKYDGKRFFSFANTVATINFYKTFKGHGWLGVRFQLNDKGGTNDFIIHVKLHDNDPKLQQEAIGVLGVNMIYACYHYYDDPTKMIQTLYDDEIDRSRIEIDMVQLSGVDFEEVDNRLLSLHLVKNDMTDAVIFGPDGQNMHPSEVLYKKNILALRGSFRPVTKVNIDMIKNGYKEFTKEKDVNEDNLLVLFEITLNNLKSSGDLDEQDFLDRAEILCALGQTVLISNFQKYFKLIEYFSSYSKKKMGLIMGIHNFVEVIDAKYYTDLNGGILEACGIMFSRDLKIYLYPYKENDDAEMTNSDNLIADPFIKPLFDYFKLHKKIIDLKGYNPDVLTIFSLKVLQMIKDGEEGWESMVPSYVDNIIKEKRLFGYKPVKKAVKALNV